LMALAWMSGIWSQHFLKVLSLALVSESLA
jgi:hypothetical protein